VNLDLNLLTINKRGIVPFAVVGSVTYNMKSPYLISVLLIFQFIVKNRTEVFEHLTEQVKKQSFIGCNDRFINKYPINNVRRLTH